MAPEQSGAILLSEVFRKALAELTSYLSRLSCRFRKFLATGRFLAMARGDATGVLFQVIRPRPGCHLRVAEKLGDEPNRTTADQAGSFR